MKKFDDHLFMLKEIGPAQMRKRALFTNHFFYILTG